MSFIRMYTRVVYTRGHGSCVVLLFYVRFHSRSRFLLSALVIHATPPWFAVFLIIIEQNVREWEMMFNNIIIVIMSNTRRSHILWCFRSSMRWNSIEKTWNATKNDKWRYSVILYYHWSVISSVHPVSYTVQWALVISF